MAVVTMKQEFKILRKESSRLQALNFKREDLFYKLVDEITWRGRGMRGNGWQKLQRVKGLRKVCRSLMSVSSSTAVVHPNT